MRGIFAQPTFQVLEKGIEGSTKRQGVLTNNIANVDTPGFKRSDVTFKGELHKALNKKGLPGEVTHHNHRPIGRQTLSAVHPQKQRDYSTSMREDGNNVDIELETAAMAKNGIYHSTLTQQLNNKFGMLRTVINEGRR
ncbi:flagellar basal body rod protein FlgB [Proteinivorax hydrogeniformans]|uniref:Flagellar basal body rod protein FlgB n=1 Tax=Proteinivorax hydrogeniformans TaxID=1826727 RepID=A0AAU8HR15_9FIRM